MKTEQKVVVDLITEAIKQIRNNQQPDILESEAIIEVDLSSHFFKEKHEIISISENLMGGIQIEARFATGNIVSFWLYWLGEDNTPTIRAIYSLDNKKL